MTEITKPNFFVSEIKNPFHSKTKTFEKEKSITFVEYVVCIELI